MWKRKSQDPEIRRSDVAAVKAKLQETDDGELLGHLYDFGKVLLDEVQQRTALLDGKLTNLLAWSAGITALVLVGYDPNLGRRPWYEVALILCAIIFSIAAVICASVGLRTHRGWNFPSEMDWFRTDLFGNGPLLMKYHILGMLEAHQAHNVSNIHKGHMAIGAQIFLALAASCIGAALAARLLVLLLYT